MYTCILRSPALHPELGITFPYISKFLYILEGNMFQFLSMLLSAHSTKSDIRICMPTEDYLCLFSPALFPAESLEWFVYTLFCLS